MTILENKLQLPTIAITIAIFYCSVVDAQICGDLIDGKPYFFDNQEFKCQLDTDTCTNAAGVRAITWYRAGFMGVDPKNEYHYIKKVAWSNDTFLIMTAWDFFALDVCDGYLTKAVPTCTSSQLYKSIPGPTNGTCYLVPQPMCSDNVITSVGQKSGCSNHAYLTVEAATGATKQLWKFTADSITSWSPRFPACASSATPPSNCPTYCGPSTTSISSN